MVFTYLIFYLLLISFLLFFLYTGIKKGKTVYSKYKKMEEVYDKYENLRSCRRELVVINNNYFLFQIVTLLLGRGFKGILEAFRNGRQY